MISLGMFYICSLDMCFFYSCLDMWYGLFCILYFFLVFIGFLCFRFLSAAEILKKKK